MDFKRYYALPVAQWTRHLTGIAEKILKDTLAGVGGDWEHWATGEVGKHLRRRLAPREVKLLHAIMPTAPVFTHGKALELI